MRFSIAVLGILQVVALALDVTAHAQRAFDVQTFVPPAGRAVALTIPEPELGPHATLYYGAHASYASDALVREVSCDANVTVVDSSCVRGERDGRTPLVADLGQFEIAFAAALYRTLELGVVVPFAVSRVADDLVLPQRLKTRLAPGDLRLSVGVLALPGDTALRLGFVATLPTGAEEALVGARNWTATPSIVLRQRIGKASIAGMLGYRLRQRTEYAGLEHDDELDMALGARIPIVSGIEVLPELRARVGVGGKTVRENENPLEADLGFGFSPGDGTSIVLGGGLGLWPGRDGYGAPAVRVFAMLRREVGGRPCVLGPEDADGYRDGDACRDPDNDRDGIDDEADACPNDAEDRDGFLDGDGCPDRDDDADGLRDDVDACPRASEDVDGYQDDDGCPELDNDEDGLPDASDRCAMEPEDKDGYQDADGCAEPGPKPLSISVQERRILVSERIYFEYDRDTIRAVSAPVLDELARAILALGPTAKVVVEGHTDDTGNEDYNLDLSHRRARSVVEYLAGRGVPRERLEFIGFGAQQPLGPSDSPEGRELNRRVEFRLAR